MINKTLYAREMKNSVKLLFILAAVMALYIGIIIYMYEPEMMALLDSYVDAMPEMMAAVGMTAGATDLLGFMISYLYGFILLVFPMIFCILRADRLLARYTTSGAMSYLLAAPVSRQRIVTTQIAALISGTFLLILFATALEILVAEHFFPGDLDIPDLLCRQHRSPLPAAFHCKPLLLFLRSLLGQQAQSRSQRQHFHPRIHPANALQHQR